MKPAGSKSLQIIVQLLTLGSFLMVSTAYSQVYIDTSSTRYVREETASASGLIKNQQTQSPAPAPAAKRKSFSFGASRYLSHGPALVWDGCAKGTLVRGGKGTNTGCDQDYLHPKMASHMEKHFFNCAVEAALIADMPRPARIHLNHAGCYQNRNVAGRGIVSLHALARAIDIYNFNMYDSEGNLTRVSANISAYKGKNKTFYDSFRSCWRKTLPSRCRVGYSREQEGSIGIPNSKMGGNWAHADHLHLTFPPCGG